MKPFTHAKNSARKYGGSPDDYIQIHNFFDQTKAHIPDMRHRAVLHNSFGIFLCESQFGVTITNSNGVRISVRDVAEDHVLEDLGTIPTLQDCFEGLPLSKLLGARMRVKLKLKMPEGIDAFL